PSSSSSSSGASTVNHVHGHHTHHQTSPLVDVPSSLNYHSSVLASAKKEDQSDQTIPSIDHCKSSSMPELVAAVNGVPLDSSQQVDYKSIIEREAIALKQCLTDNKLEMLRAHLYAVDKLCNDEISYTMSRRVTASFKTKLFLTLFQMIEMLVGESPKELSQQQQQQQQSPAENNQRRLSSESKGSIDEEIVVDEDSNDGKPTSAAVNTTIASLSPKSPNMVVPKSITPISSSSSASSNSSSPTPLDQHRQQQQQQQVRTPPTPPPPPPPPPPTHRHHFFNHLII
ncbi:hypothetical protein RDWZM_004759, partial [Blomia tropicalis]